MSRGSFQEVFATRQDLLADQQPALVWTQGYLDLPVVERVQVTAVEDIQHPPLLKGSLDFDLNRLRRRIQNGDDCLVLILALKGELLMVQVDLLIITGSQCRVLMAKSAQFFDLPGEFGVRHIAHIRWVTQGRPQFTVAAAAPLAMNSELTPIVDRRDPWHGKQEHIYQWEVSGLVEG